MKDAGNSAFVCPTDRQLQLRAKLNSGWSFHSCRSPTRSSNNSAHRPNQPFAQNQSQALRDDELERIKKVLERAQRIDHLEQERIGKLVDRLENMKKHANGNGSTQCFLCADGFGMLGASSVTCLDCHKSVCNKCSIETVFNQQMISLCKICSENRELWKKSGAWFFRSLPQRANSTSSNKTSTNAKKKQSLSNDDDSSSEDRQSQSDRFNHRGSSFASKTSRIERETNEIDGNFRQDSLTNSNNSSNTQNVPSSSERKHSSIEQDRDESIDSFKLDDHSCKELSIEEYLPKSQGNNSISAHPRTSTVIFNTSSPVDDCGFGTLDFEVMWRESLNVLTISLLRARNLRSCDSNGLSDPYVKLHLVPGVAKATKLRSHTIRRTLNPDFDETLVYHGISLDDIKQKSLKFSVYDEDSVGSDFLGEYRLKLSTIRPDVKEAYAVFLQNKTDLPTDEDKNERGKILISLLYSKVDYSLRVKVIRGTQLLPMDFGQTSDPYCKLVLFPTDETNGKYHFKTSVKRHTLQPEFHEEFVFQNISLPDLMTKTFQLTVFDYDMGRKDDYIGGFQLSQTASGDESKHWLLMAKNPDQPIEMWHKLSSEQYMAPVRRRDSQLSR